MRWLSRSMNVCESLLVILAWRHVVINAVLLLCGFIAGQALETTKHMLQCPLLTHPCTLCDLQKLNENARKCVETNGRMRFDDTKEEELLSTINLRHF